jgi:hypothetical protein
VFSFRFEVIFVLQTSKFSLDYTSVHLNWFLKFNLWYLVDNSHLGMPSLTCPAYNEPE